MSVRRIVFDEFQFDENLRAYSLGEDFLFSNSIYKKYPDSLLLSPDIQFFDSYSKEARPNDKERCELEIRNGKYILTRLWGFKGLLIFARQLVGLKILEEIERIKR